MKGNTLDTDVTYSIKWDNSYLRIYQGACDLYPKLPQI